MQMKRKVMPMVRNLVQWVVSGWRGMFGAPPDDCTPDKAPLVYSDSGGLKPLTAPPKIAPEDNGVNLWDGFTDDDGIINTHHPVFQVGRYLYDAQVLYADCQAVKDGRIPADKVAQELTPERVMRLCRRYCQLVYALGQLRADYSQKTDLLRKLAGKRISDLMK